MSQPYREIRYNPAGAGPLLPYKSGVVITSTESPPASAAACVELTGREIEFVIEKPSAVTAFSIVYGRWVTGGFPGAGAGDSHYVSAWLPLGTETWSSVPSALALHRLQFVTHGDPVAIYLSALTGTAGANFRYWYRDIP